jgi:hypothetical protein
MIIRKSKISDLGQVNETYVKINNKINNAESGRLY